MLKESMSDIMSRNLLERDGLSHFRIAIADYQNETVTCSSLWQWPQNVDCYEL